MRIDINNGQSQKQRMFLKAEFILRYLITDTDKVDTFIMCEGDQYNLVTTDAAVYEALASVKDYDQFKLNKLAKFFEVVEVRPSAKKILTHERVEELRKIAQSGD